jgi:hypothetical protein
MIIKPPFNINHLESVLLLDVLPITDISLKNSKYEIFVCRSFFTGDFESRLSNMVKKIGCFDIHINTLLNEKQNDSLQP